MAQIALITLLFITITAFSIYFLLAAFTNWLPPFDVRLVKGVCVGYSSFGSLMKLSWEQTVEVSDTWELGEEYLIYKSDYLFGYSKYVVYLYTNG
jgi:hypothetical protein